MLPISSYHIISYRIPCTINKYVTILYFTKIIFLSSIIIYSQPQKYMVIMSPPWTYTYIMSWWFSTQTLINYWFVLKVKSEFLWIIININIVCNKIYINSVNFLIFGVTLPCPALIITIHSFHLLFTLILIYAHLFI